MVAKKDADKEAGAMPCSLVFNYGGGRQTVAMCIMIAKGVLPKPDVIIMADTARENPSTWQYLCDYTQPLMQEMGLEIEIASHDLAKVDLYGHNGDLLLPVFTQEGKLPGYCSNEWKKRVCDRHLRAKGIKGGTRWLGLALEERGRWAKQHNNQEGKWKTVCPLVDYMINTEACFEIVKSFGWPEPPHSSCWMCPNKRNAEWRRLKDESPEEWAKAVEMDKELREADEQGGVFLHQSRVPLEFADLDAKDVKEKGRQCSLGMCFV